MARRFSIGEAIGEPFRQAFRRPVTTMAWGLITMVPSFIIFAAMGPMLAEMIERGGLAAAGGQPGANDFESFNQFMMFQAWSGLSNTLSLVALLVVTTAIIRAVLRAPRRDRVAFLRLSKDEFHVAVIGVAIVVGVGIIAALGIAVIAAFGIVGATTGAAWAMWTAVLLGFALFAGLVVLWGRLALIAPTAVITGDLAFEAGWRAGRRQTGRLLLLMLALIVVSILIAIGFLILFILAAIVFGGGLEAWADEAAVEAWMLAQLENPLPLIAVSLVALIPLSWIQGFSTALWTAPYAVAARSLVPSPGAEGADAGGGEV
ncbi:MAG: hypothetical protein KJ676_00280 [Alphaproteobacteria bacterium]|nr:hypothetical protein [Alphaproteobacteria bacterium]MBU1527168.1 hypothetical protein [Alphaproteobacteria bacterium]MBU2118496.1 hypothetical protein [Alphaproteobacteria bacterium]MBU2351769.1 hypothetical protein [Alphaproteobacteria bacterium]MBU2383379.1 hypothetical protein [Alphaproteobacteria bacterium]